MSRSVPYDLDRPDVPPAEEIVALASRAAAADGDPPFSDQTLVDLRSAREGRVRTVLARSREGELLGAAVRVPEPDGAHLVELVVGPSHRGAGIGAALAGAVAAGTTGTVRAWAHGASRAMRRSTRISRSAPFGRCRSPPRPRLPPGAALRRRSRPLRTGRSVSLPAPKGWR